MKLRGRYLRCLPQMRLAPKVVAAPWAPASDPLDDPAFVAWLDDLLAELRQPMPPTVAAEQADDSALALEYAISRGRDFLLAIQPLTGAKP